MALPILKWGKQAFKPFNGLCSKYEDEKSHNFTLDNGALVLRPANGYKSAKGSVQYDGDKAINLNCSVLTFHNDKLIAQLRNDALGVLFPFEGKDVDNQSQKWIDNGCVVIIPVQGNKQLELIHDLFKGLYLSDGFMVHPNGEELSISPDDSTAIKEVLAASFDDWEDEDKELLLKYGLPSEQIASDDLKQRNVYKKVFGYLPKTLEELQVIGDAVKIEVKEGSSSGGSKGYGSKGGGSIVNVYQNETSLEKFKSFCIMLGLPETSTIIDVLKSPTDEAALRLALTFCGLTLPDNGFSASPIYQESQMFEILAKSPLELEQPLGIVVSLEDTQATTKALIIEKLGKARGKLPKDWDINPELATLEWCECMTLILENKDLTDIATINAINLLAGDNKQPSIVLYDASFLAKLVDEFDLLAF
jgi:hypothetical protein